MILEISLMTYFFSRVDFKVQAYRIALLIEISHADQFMKAILRLRIFISGMTKLLKGNPKSKKEPMV